MWKTIQLKECPHCHVLVNGLRLEYWQREEEADGEVVWTAPCPVCGNSIQQEEQ